MIYFYLYEYNGALTTPAPNNSHAREGLADSLLGNFSYLCDLKYSAYWTTWCFGGFIHSFSKYFLCIYYMQSTGLDPGDVALNKMDNSPVLMHASGWELNL